MLVDKRIPYKNFIMRIDLKPSEFPKKIILKDGFNFRSYREGDAETWAKLECMINDFDTYENALSYFKNKYEPDLIELSSRFIAIENNEKQTVGLVIAWFDIKNEEWIPTVHWLVVHPDYQNLGLGSSLIKKLLNRHFELGAKSVFLHTQPWSYAAIKLYVRNGFYALKKVTYASYNNQYDEAVSILKNYLDSDTYHKILENAR